MNTRRSGHRGLAAGVPAAVLVTALLVASPTASAPSPVSLPPLPKGWGWMFAAGVVAGLDPGAGTATLAVAGHGRGATFEGGSQWRPQTVAGSQVVHVLPSTVMADADDQPVTIAAIRAGAPVTLWAVVRPDATVLALKLRLGSGSKHVPRPSAGAWTPAGVTGAVAHATASVLDLLTAPGTLRKVIVTSATTIRNGAGAAARSPAIGPYDIVRAEGTVNSDGSVAATRIDVQMEAAAAPQVSGAVDQVFGDVGAFVMSGVAVAIAPGCYWFKGSAPGASQQLVAGQPAVVYGDPIVSGTTPVGLRARVVAMR